MGQHDLSKDYNYTCGSSKARLEADGSTSPRLHINLFEGKTAGYVTAFELRALAKQLKKWAKGLEQHATPD